MVVTLVSRCVNSDRCGRGAATCRDGELTYDLSLRLDRKLNGTKTLVESPRVPIPFKALIPPLPTRFHSLMPDQASRLAEPVLLSFPFPQSVVFSNGVA